MSQGLREVLAAVLFSLQLLGATLTSRMLSRILTNSTIKATMHSSFCIFSTHAIINFIFMTIILLYSLELYCVFVPDNVCADKRVL